MMDGTVAVPDVQLVGGLNRLRDIVFRLLNRCRQWNTFCHNRGQCGRQRATCAVGVLGLGARPFKPVH